ncbi:NAD-dependent epimerase/dehydratase family protein [Rossellomorea marisflavi]|uniref:NAD-dependent epimerase/dehydratase family protein n=1 Tax=Rossellomorea marisflavi TaxID=189381 RepID=UPI0009A7A1BA|nr:NAD-dependent epimerase/dehydratase family protein [Rossellomorea marisflavi]
MKKILITGKNSYVGTSFEKWLMHFPGEYQVELISLRGDAWKEKDFSAYDAVFHVAGIAHMKETKKNSNLYYKINCDLAYEVAKKARLDGVAQFLFLSSMSVYGINCGVINSTSILNPQSSYGKSKLKAEKLILNLDSEFFKVVVLRPPMIYGRGCKGNYQKLSKIGLRIPIFPKVNNQRSMIYISNFCEFVRMLIKETRRGIYMPQNKEYICTSQMVKLIGACNGNKIRLTRAINPILRVIKSTTLSKVFGSLVYEQKLSKVSFEYHIHDFNTSILLTERGDLYGRIKNRSIN